MKKIINFLLGCLIVNIGYSQEFCQSIVNGNNAFQLETFFKNNQVKNYNGQMPMVRLALHNVVRDDGTGGNSWIDIRSIVNQLPVFFEPHNICFTVVSEDNISNDDFFNLTTFSNNSTTWQDMVQTNVINNAINIYFVSDANSGGKATGFLFDGCTFQDINYPTVSLSNSTGNINTFSTQILAHEIGHCLGLYHTHQSTISAGTCGNSAISCLEEIPRTGNQSNCDDCGDFLCDTPADPGLALSNGNVSDATCQYIGGGTLNGFNYQPDTRNVMSYTLPHCMQWFTNGQGNRMRNFILNSTVFDDYVIPVDINISGNVNGNRYYGTESSISSSANHTNGQHIYEAGNEIRLEPGFSISATNTNTFNARIALYSCIEPLVENSGKRNLMENVTQEFNDFQIFPNPTKSKFSLLFNLPYDDAISIKIVDLAGKTTILYNGLVFAENNVELSFDLPNYSTGVYFIHLSNSNITETKKLIIE